MSALSSITTNTTTTTTNTTTGNRTEVQGLMYSVDISIIIGLVLALLTIGCIIGNSLVILSVFLVNKLKTPSNCLIVSLAVSDLLVAITVMPFSIMYALIGKWPLSAEACSMWVTFDVMLCTASILNIMMISIDRYLVITRPFHYAPKRNMRLMLIYIAIAWIISLLISITPMVVGWTTALHDGQCMVNQAIGYQVYATFVAFYLPLGVMIALYGRIYCISTNIANAEVKNNPVFIVNPQMMMASESVFTFSSNSKSIHDVYRMNDETALCNGNLLKSSEHKESNMRKSLKHQQKSVKTNHAIQTLGVLMGLFSACWLPFFVLAVVRPMCNCYIPNWVVSFLTWLGYINSGLNPIIYAYFNRDFRTPFKEILCCRCHTINASVRKTYYAYQYGD